MTAIPQPIPSPTSSALWKTAQAIGALATAVLLVGLVAQPEVGLFILWNVLIPPVPISLLLSPRPMVARSLALLVVGIWLVEALPKALPQGATQG